MASALSSTTTAAPLSPSTRFELHGRRVVAVLWSVSFLIHPLQITICACGTSWHAALVGEYLLETLANIRVEVEYASEFRYRRVHPPHALAFTSSIVIRVTDPRP